MTEHKTTEDFLTDPDYFISENEFDVALICISHFAHMRRSQAVGKRGKERKMFLDGEKYYRNIEMKLRRFKLAAEMKGVRCIP